LACDTGPTSRSSGGRACPAASRLKSISKQAHADPSCPRQGHATIYTPEHFHPPRASPEAADRSRRATLRRCRVFSRSAAPPPCRGGGISSNRCRVQACTSPTADAVAGAVPRGGDYEPAGGRPAAAADRHLLRLAARTRPERHPPPALRRWRWRWPAPGRPVGPGHLRPVRRRILPATPSTSPWGSYRSTGKLAAPPAWAATALTDSTNTSGPSVQLTLISLLRGCRHRTPYCLDCRRDGAPCAEL